MNGRELDLFWILVTVWEEVNGDLVWKCQKLSLKVAKLQLCLVPPAPQMRHSGGGVGHGLAGVGGGIPWVPELHPPNPYPDRLTTHDRNQRY